MCGRAFLVLWGASPRGGVLGPRVTVQLTYGSRARLSLYPSPGSMPSVTSLWGPDLNRWGSLLGTLILSAAESPRVLFSSSTQKISAFRGSPDALSFLCVCVCGKRSLSLSSSWGRGPRAEERADSPTPLQPVQRPGPRTGGIFLIESHWPQLPRQASSPHSELH